MDALVSGLLPDAVMRLTALASILGLLVVDSGCVAAPEEQARSADTALAETTPDCQLSDYGGPNGDPCTLRVATYNINFGRFDRHGFLGRPFKELGDELRLLRPDFIGLQESTPSTTRQLLESIFASGDVAHDRGEFREGPYWRGPDYVMGSKAPGFSSSEDGPDSLILTKVSFDGRFQPAPSKRGRKHVLHGYGGKLVATWDHFTDGSPNLDFFTVSLDLVEPSERARAARELVTWIDDNAGPNAFIAASLDETAESASVRAFAESGWVDAATRAPAGGNPAGRSGVTSTVPERQGEGAAPSRRTDYVFARDTAKLTEVKRFMTAPDADGYFQSDHFGIVAVYVVRLGKR